jgi:hypothetical protein
MVAMNRRMNLPALTGIMQQFGIANQEMEATQEIMGEAVDQALGGEEDVRCPTLLMSARK